MDRSPLFLYQSLLWAHSLVELAGVPADRLVVHALPGCDPEHLVALRGLGLRVEAVQPHDIRNPFANKLAQLPSPALRDAEFVVLCDTDLAFLDSISSWISGGALRAKVVDHSQPNLVEWQRIINMAGLEPDVVATRPSHSTVPTWRLNFNAGLLILPEAVFRSLSPAWARWHGWVLDNAAEFGPRTILHAVQVSLGLALAELGLEADALPVAANFPTHLEYRRRDRETISPTVLHYHDRIDRSGRLLPTGMPGVDAAIKKTNALVRRHATDPEVRAALAAWRASRPGSDDRNSSDGAVVSRIAGYPRRLLTRIRP